MAALQTTATKSFTATDEVNIGLLDAGRDHLCRDPKATVLISGVSGKQIRVSSVRARTSFSDTNPLGATGSVPFVFALSYGDASESEYATTDFLRGCATLSYQYRADTDFLVPNGKDLLLYVVSFAPEADIRSTFDVEYTMVEPSAPETTAAATTNPIEAPAGLELWMDAAMGVRYNDSYVVSSWQDQSPNDYASTGDPGGTFTVANSGANNLPTVAFDGGAGGFGADVLALPNSSVVSIAYPISIFAVIDPGRSGNYDGLFTAGTNGDEFSLNVRSDKINVYADTFGANQDTLSDSVIPSGFNVVGITCDDGGGGFGVTLQYYMNGVTDGSYNVDYGTAITGTGRWLGGDASSQFFLGDIAEMVVYSTLLTSDEIDDIHTYFNDKYAI